MVALQSAVIGVSFFLYAVLAYLGPSTWLSLLVPGILVISVFAIVREPNPVERALVIFWSLTLAALLLSPTEGAALFAKHFISLLHAVLFAGTVLPMLVGYRPFTEYFARQRTSPSIWEGSDFYRINAILSGFWGILFLVGMVFGVLLPSVAIAVPIVGLLGTKLLLKRLVPSEAPLYLGQTVSLEQTTDTSDRCVQETPLRSDESLIRSR